MLAKMKTELKWQKPIAAKKGEKSIIIKDHLQSGVHYSKYIQK